METSSPWEMFTPPQKKMKGKNSLTAKNKQTADSITGISAKSKD